MELPTTDFDGQAALDDGCISTVEEIRSEDEFDPIFEQYLGEPFFHYMRSRYCPYSIPPYFKRDHPDDDLFMEEVRSHPKYVEKDVDESVTKQVVVELIWRATHTMKDIWNNKELEDLYTTIIESAACLVYLLYPQTELYRIHRDCIVKEQLNRLRGKLEEFCKEGRSYDAVCIFVLQLISNNYEYNLVTEEAVANMLFNYPDFRASGFPCLSYPSFPIVADENHKDKLYYDIAKVVKDLKPPPPLQADEYTHWMLTFLRGNALDVEINIMRKTTDDRNKLPIQGRFHELRLFSLFYQLLYSVKHRVKDKLADGALPLIKICDPMRHKMSRVIIEIVQVAQLRRMALGSRFIGRSHLIWAFYKLGYSLPLEIRNRLNFHDADEDHPPYHIYMAAVKLASLCGAECAKLVHFIFAVIHSKDIGIDGQGVTELYRCFEVFKRDLEEMENEIEPKHTVTMRSCRAVDAIIQEMRERYDN